MEQQFASGTLMNRSSANALSVYGSHWCVSQVSSLQFTELWDMKGLLQRNRGDNASSTRNRSRGFLSWKEPTVLAAAVMEEEECEDGSNWPASGRKRSREKFLRGSLRGCTMLLRYRRNVAATRTSNQYGAIGCQVFAHVAATCQATITNEPQPIRSHTRLRVKNFYKRLISETIHIEERKDDINSNKNTELLDVAYYSILEILSNHRSFLIFSQQINRMFEK
ncbi:hypothetical protein ALC60_12739 [Trachymyrmex zeteki]|uniref:Uncharacterized protein n=1 Tax=Mycetomoellerius zeteki TaxID=64791 RepID=A0A151WKH6_9HYME|nr:hypothetical protein ALC60_12739 [Trachymyrmex zeteki]